ncbi:cytochrome aa3 quinol oxidase subunit II [Pseudobacillus badius]|uniref:cytochrome aa3 quinol oxidase subunit II n=1 Tax=Bacillus badius TaxID=1455 RepID=UPI0007B06135|nr:cytochrome aa3 quinol oxidase subunit II [Bacillus badius]KZN99668.1 cytochrome aa3 quinol oxidase subunit II [Bacillus badius]OCS85773.1 cytochrome aa3 quinol oxidase subunit II [Bacillus badius]OVE51869.1 cytochrome aa3 quinol oxidase subunit II [Bacillus badius]TDW03298.1 cytochrome aa3 quinol oxidase subunit 2 [Bacillus badius]UAT32191.1 cytochrome aa3 quinol oxidase subunit II [Bacillus badius]
MKVKWLLLSVIFAVSTALAGCDSPLMVLDPKGPQAKTLSDTIIFSIMMMVGILLVVYILYAFVLVKYRASKMDKDYEPPHEEGNKWLELIWTVIPIIIVIILSVVTVRTTDKVESVPAGYANEKPLVIYASSSNWKWHFSYPEEGIETVNYVNLPTDRPVEFRLYSYGPITSFWIPQLAGQKYAMSDMVTKIHLSADTPGSYMGKNSNFSGEGFAHMEFEAQAMTPSEYKEWVSDVKQTAPKLTEKEFDQLLETPHVGRKTYTSTHLEFKPAPEGEHAGHHHGEEKEDQPTGHEDHKEHDNMDHMEHMENKEHQ